MFKLAICAIAKDEREDYIREWAEWHLKLGVDFIYIFDNESKIPLKDALSDIPNLGVAPCRGRRMQIPAYDFFLNRYRGIVEWCAFIDIDEFIIENTHASIATQLEFYPNYAGVALQWRTFGSNNLIDNSDLQIKAFTKRALDNSDLNQAYKSIVRLDKTSHAIQPHGFNHNPGCLINNIGIPIDASTPVSTSKSYGSFYINHYSVRSYNDYLQKLERGHPYYGWKKNPNIFELYAEANQLDDFVAVELWERIKNKEYKKTYIEKVYLEKNPDVIQFIDTRKEDSFNCLMDHWLLQGRDENRQSI